ncbi:protease-associated domain-containing protein 1-like [Antedon mediterranea]|uniref:protease-associated domain-containing protein 1-like n=1 Tax=Antedon mediterranea TaxID=105859 RepID=UPI003AF5B376
MATYNVCKTFLKIFLKILFLCLFFVPLSGYSAKENLFFEILEPESLNYVFKVRQAKSFGGIFNLQFSRISLVLADPLHGCSPLQNSYLVQNSVVLIQRGECSFLSKTLNAEQAGAMATVIYDKDTSNDWQFIDMVEDGTERKVTIPAVFLLGRDGHNIRQVLENNEMSEAIISIPVNVTGVPFHSYKFPPWSLV